MEWQRPTKEDWERMQRESIKPLTLDQKIANARGHIARYEQDIKTEKNWFLIPQLERLKEGWEREVTRLLAEKSK